MFNRLFFSCGIEPLRIQKPETKAFTKLLFGLSDATKQVSKVPKEKTGSLFPEASHRSL